MATSTGLLLLATGMSLVGAVRHSQLSLQQGAALRAPDGDLMKAFNVFTDSKYQYDPRPGRDFFSMTIIDMLEEAAAKHPEELALRAPVQDESGNLVKKPADYALKFGAKKYQYRKYTWRQYRDAVFEAAAAFVSMGLKPMDAVHIRGVNSPEWLIAFLGCIAAGGLPVGLYPTDSPEALRFKAEDSGAVFVAVAKVSDLRLYSSFIDELPSVKGMVFLDGAGTQELPQDVLEALNTAERPLLLWAGFMARGKDGFQEEVQQRVKNLKPGQAASVVYTSGTTGNPKGVMLSHDSIIWAADRTSTILTKKPPGGHHRIVSYLPLNHVAGQMLDIMWPLYATTAADTYVTTFFPALCYVKKRCIPEQLTDARPTVFLGVPEVWDGLRLKIELGTASGVKAFVKEHAPSVVLGGVGLDKVMFALTGAGPITKDTLLFFHDMGINVLNLFAQSESSALGTAWTNEDFESPSFMSKLGSIGKPLGNELRIEEGTGEIQLRGRNVMLGYMNRLDKTRSTITEDGWLRTGDRGRIDEDGFVYLVGRLKEIMKSFGGEMIAPVSVEQGILKACNADGQIVKKAVLQGDGAYYLSVLLTLVEDAQDGIPTGQLTGAAKAVDPAAATVAAAQESGVWAGRLSTCIGEYNKGAAKGPERVWRYAVLPKDITAESAPDLMTPTFKIKREGVSQEYEALIKTCGGAPEDGPPGKLGGVKPCGSA